MTTVYSLRAGWRNPVSARRPLFDVETFGAVRGLSVQSAGAIQKAMDAAAAVNGIVDFPGSSYLIGGQELKFYSNITLQGRGGGGMGGTAATQLYQASGAYKLFAPADPGTTTQNLEVRDLVFSSFGNSSNTGGIDLTNCSGCHLHRVTVSGAKNYGVRMVGGDAAGESGFGRLTGCWIVALDSAAAALLFSGSTNDQPDGMSLWGCYIGHAGPWIKFEGGGGHGPGSISIVASQFEVNSSSRIDAILMDSTGGGLHLSHCRFENTGSGGLAATLYGVSNQAALIEHATDWAPGAGGLTWTDNGVIRSNRVAVRESSAAVLTQLTSFALLSYALTDGTNIATPCDRASQFTVTLGGNRTMSAPTSPFEGQVITHYIKQDGTGGRTLAWNAVFHNAWSDTGNTANKESTISHRWNGTYWAQVGAQSPYV